MKLNDAQLNFFISKVLKLAPGKRLEYLAQVDGLIGRMRVKIESDSKFGVKKFTTTGSLRKGTVLRPRGDDGVDADVAVELDVSEASKGDIDSLHEKLRKLLCAVYPQKVSEDFKVQPRTLGIHFRESGLDVDLVPIIPIPSQAGYGWQPSSQGAPPVKTSVQGQLDFIKKRSDADARYRPLVRLVKGWRNSRELDAFRSFSIELIVAYLNDTEGISEDLEAGLLRFFRFVAQSELKTKLSFRENGPVPDYPNDPVVILDPVNKSNNVANRLTEGERREIVDAARNAWEILTTARRNGFKGETVDCWKEVFGRSFVIEE